MSCLLPVACCLLPVEFKVQCAKCAWCQAANALGSLDLKNAPDTSNSFHFIVLLSLFIQFTQIKYLQIFF